MVKLEPRDDTSMPPEVRQALVEFLFQVADDELVVGHRDSEWLGMAPDIEEDVAFSSIAQDEVGHATYYYELLSQLGEGTADSLAFDRMAAVRRNAVFTECENGDWAHTIVRRWLYEVFDFYRIEALLLSTYVPLRHGAVKMKREEYYHLLHLETWFQRLIVAGGEARERMEAAVQVLWPVADSLFAESADLDPLYTAGILPTAYKDIAARWLQHVQGIAAQVGLILPEQCLGREEITSLGRSSHTPALQSLLETMTEVHRMDEQAIW